MTNEDEILAMAGVTREDLGRRVRARWLEWARQQPDALEHQYWLTPWSGLDERDREVDRAIGTELFTAGWLAARKAYR